MSDYLIDFNTAIEAMKRISDCICEAEAVDALCELPTIELIRCKDCRYSHIYYAWGEELCRCDNFEKHLNSDGFCSWAEPKEKET